MQFSNWRPSILKVASQHKAGKKVQELKRQIVMQTSLLRLLRATFTYADVKSILAAFGEAIVEKTVLSLCYPKYAFTCKFFLLLLFEFMI